MKFIFIYITNPTKREAEKIAKHLLNKKLIACANIYDEVKSLYTWKEKIAEENECILIVKTLERNFKKIKEEVEKIHPYSIPCIIKIPVEPNEKYADWIKEQIEKSTSN